MGDVRSELASWRLLYWALSVRLRPKNGVSVYCSSMSRQLSVVVLPLALGPVVQARPGQSEQLALPVDRNMIMLRVDQSKAPFNRQSQISFQPVQFNLELTNLLTQAPYGLLFFRLPLLISPESLENPLQKTEGSNLMVDRVSLVRVALKGLCRESPQACLQEAQGSDRFQRQLPHACWLLGFAPFVGGADSTL